MILRKAIIKVVIKRESFIVGYYNQPKNKKQENKLHKMRYIFDTQTKIVKIKIRTLVKRF